MNTYILLKDTKNDKAIVFDQKLMQLLQDWATIFIIFSITNDFTIEMQ